MIFRYKVDPLGFVAVVAVSVVGTLGVFFEISQMRGFQDPAAFALVALIPCVCIVKAYFECIAIPAWESICLTDSAIVWKSSRSGKEILIPYNQLVAIEKMGRRRPFVAIRGMTNAIRVEYGLVGREEMLVALKERVPSEVRFHL